MTGARLTVRFFGAPLALAVLAGAASRAHAADVIEKLNGRKLRGTVIARTPDHVTIRMRMPGGGGTIEMSVPTKDIHAVTVDGKRAVLNEKPPPPKRAPRRPVPRVEKPPSPRKPVTGSRATRTKNQVLALIQQAGTTKPDWWGSVSLNYPKTLNLSWPQPSGGWNMRKNVGQYMFSVINENPRRWREGTKFMHYVLSLNKGDQSIEKKAMEQLGHCYHDLLEDWARGAYWWQKSGGSRTIGLADCYWKLGSKAMAAEMLLRISVDYSRYGAVIKLWSDMGELNRALRLAEASARSNRSGGPYMAAGDACRKHGRYPQAVAYYQKVLAIPVGPKAGILNKNRARATAAIKTIKLFETLDLRRVRSGTYTGTSVAYGGDLTLSVTVQNGRITSVRVTSHKDKQYFSSITDTTKQIIEKQGLRDIDATTGATVTSDGILNAAANALGKGLN